MADRLHGVDSRIFRDRESVTLAPKKRYSTIANLAVKRAHAVLRPKTTMSTAPATMTSAPRSLSRMLRSWK